MRFLHTADWHLGRAFHGAPLLDAQAAWLDWLVDLAREERVDGILVSGDVFDRALPPVDAVRLADDALARLVAVAPVVVISGNHDSAARLGFNARLLEAAGLHLRTDVARIGDPVRIGDAAVYGIPYLEPDLARPLLGCEERGHAGVLTAAMDRVRADLASRPAGTRAVVLAHAFVAGAAASPSERDLCVGGAATVTASVFAGADYVALGHLHAPQRAGGYARYAGSPVAFSFAEAGHVKSVVIVDLQDDGVVTELHPCPVARPLAVVRGTLDDLLADPAQSVHEASWVQVTLTDAVRPLDAMARIRARFPHAVVLAYEPEGGAGADAASYAVRLRGMDDRALADAFVRDVRGTEPSEAENTLLDTALAARRVREAVG